MGNSCWSCGKNPFSDSIPRSLKHSIEEVDPPGQIDSLIVFIEYHLNKTERQEASFPLTRKLKRLAAKFIDTISSQAKKSTNTEMGSVAMNAVKEISETHWIFLGFWAIAYVLDRYVKREWSVSECRELLGEMVDLAKEAKFLKERMPENSETVCEAVSVIVKGAVVCCDYITKGDDSRVAPLEETRHSIREKITRLRDVPTRSLGSSEHPDIDAPLSSSLQNVDLTGCINLKKLPESFGRHPIQSLTMQSLISLEELPPNFGDLPFLKDLKLISCISLKSLPESFVKLKRLESLRIESCIKLVALPEDFGQLSSLKEMIVEDCFALKDWPQGFQSLPALKLLSLISCSRLQILPPEFGKLACLEELQLNDLFISDFPDRFTDLRSLKKLVILNCYILRTFPDELENLASLREIEFKFCRKVEPTARERIEKLQQRLEKRPKLEEPRKEMQREEHYYRRGNEGRSAREDIVENEINEVESD